MNMKEQVHTLSEEMIANLGRLVAIDSQLGTPEEGKPFGAGPAKALEEGLKIAEELGFKTVNLDHYCGYAEMGEGEEIVGIAGHLDIVPVGGDWTYDPFKLTRDGDHVYGRGTTDDKGPVLEALYAMKILRDSGVKLNKRVRLIMGCNEETGSKMYGALQRGRRRVILWIYTGCQFSMYTRRKRAYVYDSLLEKYKNHFHERWICVKCCM